MSKIGDRGIDLLILLAYIVLSLAMSCPLPLHMTTHVAGRLMDTRVFQWNNWWVKEALLNGLSLNYTDRIYYPSGVSLLGHNFNWVSSFLSVPLSLLFGPAVAYNLTFLLTLFLSGFGMYLLVCHLARRRDAAFVAGLIYAFSPYHISGNWAGQMNLANTQWLPLSVLFVLRTVEWKRAGDAIAAGVFVALASLDCWFFTIFLGMWGGVFLVYSLVFQREKWNWRAVWLFLLAAVVFSVLVAPFLLPVIAGSGKGTVGNALGYYESAKSTDLLAFVIPNYEHTLWGRYVASVYESFAHWRPAFLGYSALVLAAYAAVRVWRRSAFWLLSGLLFAALALGTVLRIKGIEHPNITMPYKLLIKLFPAFKIVRQANRFNVMVALSLAVLVGLACADLFHRLERRFSGRFSEGGQYVAAIAVSALILIEYLAIPCPLLPYRVSPFYDTLAQEEGDFAIVELPLEFLYARRSLYTQTFHRKRVVNGYVARAPADAEAFVYSSPILKALRLRMAPDPTLHDIPAGMGLLAANNIRYVVIHKSPMPPHPAVDKDVLASWRALFGPTPLYEDREIVAYRVHPTPGQSLSPHLRFDDKLGLTDIQARRTRLLSKQFLTVDLTWKAMNDLDRDYVCSLSLMGPTGSIAQTKAWDISPHYPTSRWKAGVFVAERYAVSLDPSLPGGNYRLSVRVVEALSGQELDTADCAVQIGDDARPLASALDELQFPVDATFGSKLWLLGYSQQQDGDRLALRMYWQALQTMQMDYKIFVHLIRPSDGVIVAQKDVMPRGWSYPTSFWSRQEVFVDRIELDIKDVESGEYRIAAGVYRPETGRLAALDAHGRPIPDDRVFFDKTLRVR